MSTITRPVAVRMMPVSFTEATVVPRAPSTASGNSKGSRRPPESYFAPGLAGPALSSVPTMAARVGAWPSVGCPEAALGVRGAEVPGAGRVPGLVEVVGADGGEPPQADTSRARPTQPTGPVDLIDYSPASGRRAQPV